MSSRLLDLARPQKTRTREVLHNEISASRPRGTLSSPWHDGHDPEAEEDAGPANEGHEPEPEEDVDLLVDYIERKNAQSCKERRYPVRCQTNYLPSWLTIVPDGP